jgi:hypothetical protein
MLYERDAILKDLRRNVIEIFVSNSNSPKDTIAFRATLREDLLPQSYQQEKLLEQNFHEENKNLLSAFNVANGQWITVDISNVRYVQIIDGY